MRASAQPPSPGGASATSLSTALAGPSRRAIGAEMVWSGLGFVSMATSGAATYFLIGRCYGAQALGVFSQAYAIYVVLSQVVVFGVQFSVLRYSSAMSPRDPQMRAMLWGAVWLVLACACATAAAVGLMHGALGALFDSAEVGTAVAFVLPGLIVYACNKIFVSWLNGTGRIREVAWVLGLRGILIVVWVLVLYDLQAPGEMLSAALAGAELTLFLGLIGMIARSLRPTLGAAARQWVRTHARFGAKALGSGVILELNARVDVIMLGVFLSDRVVGIYSVAAMAFEAVLQICHVFRISLNPRLGRLHARGKLAMLEKFVRAAIRSCYKIFVALAAAAAATYPLAIDFVFGSEFSASAPCFAILMLGFALASGYKPLDMLLLQAGFPGWQTAVLGGAVVANVILNAGLIPAFGITGAALATAASLPVGALLLKLAARQLVGIRV